jgi:hypothetical protein
VEDAEVMRHAPLYISQRKWRQGPTCRRVKTLKGMRSDEEKSGAKSGQNGPRLVGLAHSSGGSMLPLT